MFRPFDTLTIGEFSIVMNRYLEETNQHADSNKRIDIMNFLKEVSTR